MLSFRRYVSSVATKVSGTVAGTLHNTYAAPASTAATVKHGTTNITEQKVESRRPQFLNNKLYLTSDFIRNKPMSPNKMFTRYRRLGPDSRTSHENDPFIQLAIDPLREFENPNLLNTFMTRLGKIKPRNETGLSWKSQRKVGKAIRRAKSLGIVPEHSRFLEGARSRMMLRQTS